METKIIDPGALKGWGIDTDLENEPTYPIKHYTGDDHKRKNWQRPVLQDVTVELLMSTERPYVSAVFGTKNPPRGLSGALRRLAFRYSENMYRHWITLLLADRVDVIEGIFSDLAHGRIPRVYQEKGWGALRKHKPGMFARKVIVRVLLVAAAAALTTYLVRRNQAN